MDSVLGAVNVYCLMWPNWADLLKPLSHKSCKTFVWTPEMAQAWLDIQDQCALSLVMEANLQDMTFPGLFTSWKSKMFPEQVKILNQMQYASACTKVWQLCCRPHSYLLSWPPQTPQDVLHLFDDGTAMHSIRSTISTTLKTSPGGLHSPKICSSMFLSLWNDKPSCEIQKPWSFLKTKQQCINYDFYVGQCVFKYDHTIKGKQAFKYSSPYEIVHVHVNGTITIKLWPGVMKWINICCTVPYKDPRV